MTLMENCSSIGLTSVLFSPQNFPFPFFLSDILCLHQSFSFGNRLNFSEMFSAACFPVLFPLSSSVVTSGKFLRDLNGFFKTFFTILKNFFRFFDTVLWKPCFEGFLICILNIARIYENVNTYFQGFWNFLCVLSVNDFILLFVG